MRLQTIIKAIAMVAAALHSLQRGTVSLKLTGERRLHQLTTRSRARFLAHFSGADEDCQAGSTSDWFMHYLTPLKGSVAPGCSSGSQPLGTEVC